jgi:hypothetical protein
LRLQVLDFELEDDEFQGWTSAIWHETSEKREALRVYGA